MRSSVEYFDVDDKSTETEDKPRISTHGVDEVTPDNGMDATDDEIMTDGLEDNGTNATDATSELKVPRERFQYT